MITHDWRFAGRCPSCSDSTEERTLYYTLGARQCLRCGGPLLWSYEVKVKSDETATGVLAASQITEETARSLEELQADLHVMRTMMLGTVDNLMTLANGCDTHPSYRGWS